MKKITAELINSVCEKLQIDGKVSDSKGELDFWMQQKSEYVKFDVDKLISDLTEFNETQYSLNKLPTSDSISESVLNMKVVLDDSDTVRYQENKNRPLAS